MARPRAHVGEAELLEKLADVALMIVDVEPLGDDALKVDPAPSHDAVWAKGGSDAERMFPPLGSYAVASTSAQ